MIYPDHYQQEIGNYAVDHLYFDTVKGDNQSELLLVIPNNKFNPAMIRDRVEEIQESEVKSISGTYERRTEEIIDEAKIRRIEIKSRLGLSLTTDELDAIDPSKNNSVFKMSKILADRIDELKTDESKIIQK